MKGVVQSVEVTYFVHATEDGAKVANSVSALLGIDPPPVEEVMDGHFGNRITRVRYHITGEDAAKVFGRLATGLDPSARKEIGRALGDFMDEHSALYLRLDKQRIVAGRLVLSTTDSVRVKVKPRLFAIREGAYEFYRTAIGG